MPKRIKLAILPALITLLLSSLLLSSTINAQPQTEIEQQRLAKAQEDYSYQFSKYEDCHNQYINNRSAYIAFQTTTAKNNAFLTTKDCLTKIYDVYIAYIRYIKEQGNAFNWSKDDTEKNVIFKTLDDEITYFQNTQPNVGNLQTLEDTIPYASELKTHITKTTYLIIQKALATYEVAESEAALENFTNLSAKIRSFVTTRIDQNQYSSFLANWDSEIADIKSHSENYNSQARQALTTFNPILSDSGSIDSVSSFTKKTKAELLRSKAIFAEILKLI